MARVNKVSECAKPMQHAFTVDGRNKVCLIKHKITKYDKFRTLLPYFNFKCFERESLIFYFKNRLYNIHRQSIYTAK